MDRKEGEEAPGKATGGPSIPMGPIVVLGAFGPTRLAPFSFFLFVVTEKKQHNY
jgi:hypothetical protein